LFSPDEAKSEAVVSKAEYSESYAYTDVETTEVVSVELKDPTNSGRWVSFSRKGLWPYEKREDFLKKR